jgi:5'-nucleotidase
MAKPQILIINDDGIHAPGIRHLWNALKDHADVTIVAPAQEQSAVGVSLTIRQPLRFQRVEWPENGHAYSLNGTPADCVKMAVGVILKQKPDLIVSGINRGSNAGRNVFYSGTVGGTIEGVMNSIPGIAFSCYDFFDPDYSSVEKFIPVVVKDVLANPMPHGTLLNVNFPEKKLGVKGFKLARMGRQYWGADPDERTHPAEKHSYYWLGAKLAEFDEHEDSDIAWLAKGYMTAVPVHVGELTDHSHLEQRKHHFERLF